MTRTLSFRLRFFGPYGLLAVGSSVSWSDAIMYDAEAEKLTDPSVNGRDIAGRSRNAEKRSQALVFRVGVPGLSAANGRA